MNKMVLNYLIFEAYEASAIRFAHEVGVPLDQEEYSVALSSISTRSSVKLKILRGDIGGAIDELNLQYPELLEQDEYLYFKLLLMNLIEMIRKEEANEERFVMDIITFAQEKLANKAIKSVRFMEELELTMTLLLYAHNKELLPPRLGELFEVKLRREIAQLVNRAVLGATGGSIGGTGTGTVTGTGATATAPTESSLARLLRFSVWGDTVQAHSAGTGATG